MKSEDGELRIHYEKAETECMETVLREGEGLESYMNAWKSSFQLGNVYVYEP